ncbi:MAG: DNA translocase FtsK [Candidatus Coproplasma sp.]
MKNKHDNDKRSYILTKETLGVTVMLFSALVFVMLLSFDTVFMGLGKAVCTFMYGTFGYGSYLVVAALAYLGEWLTLEKRIKLKPRVGICIGVTLFSMFLLFQAVTTSNYAMDGYGNYLSQCYLNSANGYSGYCFGGVISGLIVYPVAKLMTFVGAYVIFGLVTLLFAVMSFVVIRNLHLTKVIENVGKQNRKNETEQAESQSQVQCPDRKVTDDNLYSVNENHEIVSNVGVQSQQESTQESLSAEDEDRFSRKNLGRRILFENGEFAAESYRRNMIYNENSYFNHPVHNADDYLQSFSNGNNSVTQPQSNQTSYTDEYSKDIENSVSGGAPSYVYGDKPVSDLGNIENNNGENTYNSYTVNHTAQPLNYDSASGQIEEGTFEDEQVSESDFNSEAYGEGQGDYTSEDTYVQPAAEGMAEERTEQFNGVQSEENTEQSVETDRNEDSNVIEGQPLSEEVKPQEQPTERGRGINLFEIFNSSNSNLTRNGTFVEPDTSVLTNPMRNRNREQLFDDTEGEGGTLFNDETPLNGTNISQNASLGGDRDRAIGFGERTQTEFDRVSTPINAEATREEVKPVEQEKPKHVWKKYVRPTLDLLDDYPENNNVNTGEIEESKQIICETLANFRIDSRIANVVVGPAITRYDVIIEDRTNIKNALKYRDAIAMALMKENVNAYLNYAKGAISIEVPNAKRTTVGLKGMLASSEFINAKPNSLTFTLGKNVEGTVVCPDITKMPHLLVAGTTGSGKSICLSTLIVSLLYKYGPEELRFILVDPKQVEFISYDKLPHLMINEIIYDVDKAMKALNWAIKEMERRYALFKEMTEKGIATKNLTEYNAHLPEGEEKLPKIVIILDEFGDLMLQAKKDIESRIIRLVQKARACGIHLILATQRPSVDCITGLIKSNLPTRIGFKVNSFDDSRCIFDIGGAEKLLGKGDLYFRSAENPELARIQGCFIDTHEVQKVTDYIKANNETYFDQSVSDFINKVEEEPTENTSSEGSVLDGDSSKVDDTFIKALWFCVTSNQASVSMIQRRFPIGYMKACKIIDWMENMNYITQSEGSKPRKVLLSKDEFIAKYGDVDD